MFPVVAFGPLYKLGAIVLAVVAFGVTCWWQGAEHAEDKAEARRQAELAVMFRHAQALTKRADEITLVYLTQTRTVREKGNTIIREVPKYVTEEHDRACPTVGLIGLLNAAARNELPSTPASPDAAVTRPPANP